MREKIRQMDFLSKIILILMIFSLFLILMAGTRGYLRRVKHSTYNIILNGDNPLTVYQGDLYVEPGYKAYNYLNKDSTSLVKTKHNIDSSIIGEYEVSYVISNFFKKNKEIRKVNVVENPLKYVDFTLKGKSIMEHNRTEKYIEPGFNVSSDKGDFTKNVIITGNVDVNKIGMYEITYTLKIGSKERSLKRIVNVIGDKYTIKLNNYELTNQDVTINITSNIKDFSHFINPHNIEVNEESFDFTVDKNGVYVFHLIDTDGIDEEISVTVSNIDKVGPSGICNGFISQNKTTFNIEANDPSGIFKYSYNKKDYENNIFVLDGVIDKADVYVYDKATNLSIITCNIEYEYIAPTTDNYLYQYKSDTLKYWIEDKTTYKTTHIWMSDAYNQMRVALPGKRGSLWTGRAIINNAIKNNNYTNKGLVAINASGIVGGGFNSNYTGLKPAWEGTTAIPFILNKGEVIRDSTTSKFPNVNYLTYGLKKDGYLGYYKYSNGVDIEKNMAIRDEIISDGVKDTFAFYPVLVEDGKVKRTDTDKNIRQSLCQIDRNNFVIITNTSERNKGFNYKDLAKYMVSLNCKIGFNLDGGGSVNHYYKGNTSKLESITASSRGLVDMLYFVEK